MTINDMATKLGYTYTTKRTLVQTPQGTFYTRIDHMLTDADGKVTLLRDKASVNLFLESKAQIEIPGTSGRRPK